MASSSTLAERIVDFTYDLKLSDMPPAEAQRATRLLADALACGIAAGGEQLGRELVEYARSRSGGQGPAVTLLAAEGQADLLPAVLANTAAVRMLDANDIYCPPPGEEGGHFSDAIPGVLAAAEIAGTSGAETLAAIIAVYEIQALLGCAPWRAHAWHPSTLVTWALPAPVARLLGLSRAQAGTALSISGTTGQALQSWLKPNKPVTTMKTLGPGLCAERAVEAVELARLDVQAPEDALETMLRHLEYDPASLPVARLGSQWTIRRHLIKRLPAQFYTQAATQSALDLYRQGVRAERIEEVTVLGHRGVCGMVQGSPRAFAPESQEDADHSTPFVVASALLRGRLTPADYHGEPWREPALRELMGRLRLVEEPERERARVERGVIGSRVSVRLRDGSTRSAERIQPDGHPDAPLSDDELVRKMDELLKGLRSDGTGRRLLAACDALPTAPDVSGLLAAIRE